MPLPSLRFSAPLLLRQIFAGLAGGFVLLVVLIWWRNHDILRDLFDHATMIGAAGKIEHGFKPYADVRSPMQTSVYYFNWAAEAVFGHTYLGLTRGGLVQALGGAALIFWLVRRQWSSWAALTITAAVTFGGLSQHVEFFYNPIGITCLTLVALGLAQAPNLDDWRSPRAWLLLLVLAVSGTNKLNFHGLILAVAGVLLLHAWSLREISGGRLLRQIALLFLAGIVVPGAFELLWTGVTPAHWIAEVVTRPTARFDAATHFLDPRNLWRPAANFHHHLLFPYLGGIGLLLTLATGIAAVGITWRAEGRSVQLWRLCLIIGGSIGAALLMVTNYETVSLTSLAFLLVALAAVLRVPAHLPATRWLRVAGLVACLPWIVNGAYSAWFGSRVLYGVTPPDFSDYERLVDAPKALSYFEGVRFEKAQLRSLRQLAATLSTMEDHDGKLRGVVFGPALEWLERVYPEGMARHMPIWYHNGTSLSPGDQPWFAQNMAAAGATRVLVHREWQAWPPDIDDWLHTAFCPAPISDRYLMYHPIAPVPDVPFQTSAALPEPRTFLDQTSSNVHIRELHAGAGLQLRPTARGEIWGSPTTTRWDWPIRPRHISAELVVAGTVPVEHAGRVTFRVVAIDDADHEELLHELDLTITPSEPLAHAAIDLEPFGRRLRWEMQPAPDAPPLVAGWRQVRILHSGPIDPDRTPPVLPWLTPVEPPPSTSAGDVLLGTNRTLAAAGELQAPFEAWHRAPAGSTQVRARVTFVPPGATSRGPVILALCSYRDGRYDITRERQIDDPAAGPVTVEGWLPEPDAWVILQVRPANSDPAPIRIQRIEWP